MQYVKYTFRKVHIGASGNVTINTYAEFKEAWTMK